MKPTWKNVSMALLLAFFILAQANFFFIWWRIPPTALYVLYAVLILVATRSFPTVIASVFVLFALSFSTLDSVIAGFDMELMVLSLMGLGGFSLIGLRWSGTERRLKSTAEQAERMRVLDKKLSEDLRDARDSSLRFLSVVGLDLTGPLSTMLESAQSLVGWESMDNGQRSRLMHEIDGSARQLAVFNRQLRDFCQTVSGRVAARRTSFDLVDAVKDMVDGRAYVLLDYRLSLRIQAGGVEGSWDRECVVTAVRVLVDNAVKRTPVGGEVVVTIDAEGQNGIVAVEDQGPAIPSGALEALFDPHRRLATAHGFDDLGLELYLVSYVASLHGGTVDVTSENGGTTFTMCLPSNGVPDQSR